jgi:hypothetical protein
MKATLSLFRIEMDRIVLEEAVGGAQKWKTRRSSGIPLDEGLFPIWKRGRTSVNSMY